MDCLSTFPETKKMLSNTACSAAVLTFRAQLVLIIVNECLQLCQLEGSVELLGNIIDDNIHGVVVAAQPVPVVPDQRGPLSLVEECRGYSLCHKEPARSKVGFGCDNVVLYGIRERA